jgi:hypothetical protein
VKVVPNAFDGLLSFGVVDDGDADINPVRDGF